MILLISLIVDAGLILTELVKRRGKLSICRLTAISVLVNMSAFYLTAGLTAEFGYHIFLEIICVIAEKIFVILLHIRNVYANFRDPGKFTGAETTERHKQIRSSKQNVESNENRERKVLLSVYLLSAAVSLCVHSNPKTGLSCELLLLIYLLYSERNIRKKQQESESAAPAPGGNNLYLQTIEDSYRKNRALMHDLNNHAIAMHALAVSGEYGRLVEYIDTFSQKVKDNMFPVHSGNIVLDALLADKYHRAARHGILVLFERIRYSVSLANEDLCTIAGNLFDNAIEENLRCRDAAQRRISITILSDEDSLRITVRNPLFHELKLKNGLPATEKPDAEHHGMGLRNVRRACDRYGGTLMWDTADGEFSVTVDLVTS